MGVRVLRQLGSSSLSGEEPKLSPPQRSGMAPRPRASPSCLPVVRRGACVIHVASIEEAARLVLLLEQGKAMMQDAEVDSGIARVAKYTLDLLEKATCTTHQGLGAAARAARKLLGNRATKKVLQLHEAACFTRHLKDMGKSSLCRASSHA